jgi:hypothetical protein
MARLHPRIMSRCLASAGGEATVALIDRLRFTESIQRPTFDRVLILYFAQPFTQDHLDIEKMRVNVGMLWEIGAVT